MAVELIRELDEGACEHCGKPVVIANLTECLICDGGFINACGLCLMYHRSKHTDAEIEGFRREMMGESALTLRERSLLDLKAQLRAHTETVCKLIDDQEEMAKRYENQCRVLAEELDRRTPAQ